MTEEITTWHKQWWSSKDTLPLPHLPGLESNYGDVKIESLSASQCFYRLKHWPASFIHFKIKDCPMCLLTCVVYAAFTFTLDYVTREDAILAIYTLFSNLRMTVLVFHFSSRSGKSRLQLKRSVKIPLEWQKFLQWNLFLVITLEIAAKSPCSCYADHRLVQFPLSILYLLWFNTKTPHYISLMFAHRKGCITDAF